MLSISVKNGIALSSEPGSTMVERFDSPDERMMRESFCLVADQILQDQNSFQQEENWRIGFELELPLVTEDMGVADQKQRDLIVSRSVNCGKELGAHQVELSNPQPIEHWIQSPRLIQETLEEIIHPIKQDAASMGLRFLRIGFVPFPEVNATLATKGVYKYEHCPRWHRENQEPSREDLAGMTRQGIWVNDPFIVSLANATHVTVDATGFTDAIDKLNRALMISPMATALGASGQFCMGKDTGYRDIRFTTWRISHETRDLADVSSGLSNRVGLPKDYFKNLIDYFNKVLSYPFVLAGSQFVEHAFEISNGLFWRDARLKFFRDKKRVGVEFRPIATQPSLQEDIALAMFFLGRLMWSQATNENLINMSYIRKNKNSAEKFGTSGKMFVQDDHWLCRRNTVEVLGVEICRAESGLLNHGMRTQDVSGFVQIWKNRIKNGSPSEQLAREIERVDPSGSNKTEALRTAVREMCLE